MRRPGQNTRSDKVKAIIRASFGGALDDKIADAEYELRQQVSAAVQFEHREPQPVTDELRTYHYGLLALGEIHRTTDAATRELYNEPD